MKILVTGSNGQLGNEMRRVATELCVGPAFIFTDVAELDITNAAAVMTAVGGVGAIVNCAAYTNVDAAEDNEDVANLINTPAPAEGIYHYSNEGVCSWYDFAVAIGQLAGSNCVVPPRHSDGFPGRVTRPAYSVLDKTKIRTNFSLDIPHWYSSLRRCMDSLKEVINSNNGGFNAD